MDPLFIRGPSKDGPLRSYNQQLLVYFMKALKRYDWRDFIDRFTVNPNPDIGYAEFLHIYCSSYDKYFLIKTVRRRDWRTPLKEWITPGLIHDQSTRLLQQSPGWCIKVCLESSTAGPQCRGQARGQCSSS